MPIMANVTVKAANGTTDVVYVAKSPAAGDGSQAVWAVDAASTYRDQRAVAKISAADNGTRTARRVRQSHSVPIIRTIDGLPTKIGNIVFERSAIIPNGVTDSEAAEAAAMDANFSASTLIKSVFTDGMAPS